MDHQLGYHVAAMGTEAVRFLVLWMAGWIHARQLEVIGFLREKNRVLREQLDGRRLRFTDDQRRRLAIAGAVSAVCPPRHPLDDLGGRSVPSQVGNRPVGNDHLNELWRIRSSASSLLSGATWRPVARFLSRSFRRRTPRRPTVARPRSPRRELADPGPRERRRQPADHVPDLVVGPRVRPRLSSDHWPRSPNPAAAITGTSSRA
jgi:hypothetical protein